MRKIPEDVWVEPVAGVNLMPGSLGDQIGEEPALLVFLRHFGCVFCRETVSELRAIFEGDPDFPRTFFFFQGTPTEGRAFLRRYWPEARAIADPTGRFYQAFGVERGGLRKMFGPGVWSARRRANDKGHAQGERSGDIFRMPGVFLVRGREILWQHEFEHAGDLPDFAAVPARLAGAA